MAVQRAPRAGGSALKKRAAMITAAAGLIATVPPIVTALRASPTTEQVGNGNSANTNSTVNSHNSTVTNTFKTYLTAWVEGVKSMAGVSKAATPAVLAHATSSAQAAAPAAAVSMTQNSGEPEPGAVGYVVSNASLINGATWIVEPSRVPRLLQFAFVAEAVSDDGKLGRLDATLSRDGKEICTISLNSRTSSLSGDVRMGESTCHDMLPGNSGATYRAKVKASEMVPVRIALRSVVATKR